MILRYTLPSGETREYKLTDKAITIGRAGDADITIPDKLASRVHCGVSFWDDAYFLRDFKSRNGTFVNDKQIEVCRLNPGDRIKVGDTTIAVENTSPKGAKTVLMELNNAMSQGKGYHTILQEIIDEEKKP